MDLSCLTQRTKASSKQGSFELELGVLAFMLRASRLGALNPNIDFQYGVFLEGLNTYSLTLLRPPIREWTFLVTPRQPSRFPALKPGNGSDSSRRLLSRARIHNHAKQPAANHNVPQDLRPACSRIVIQVPPPSHMMKSSTLLPRHLLHSTLSATGCNLGARREDGHSKLATYQPAYPLLSMYQS